MSLNCLGDYIELHHYSSSDCSSGKYNIEYVDATGKYCNNVFGVFYKGWSPYAEVSTMDDEPMPNMDYDYMKPAEGEVCYADMMMYTPGTNCMEPNSDYQKEVDADENFYYNWWTQGNCWTYEGVQYNLEANPKGTMSIHVSCDKGMGQLTYYSEDNCQGDVIEKDTAWFNEYGVLYEENMCLEAFGAAFSMRALGYPAWDEMEKEEHGGKGMMMEQQFDDYFMYDLDLDEMGKPKMCMSHSDCSSENYCCAYVWGENQMGDGEKFTRCVETSLADQMKMEGGMKSDDMWMEMECMKMMEGSIHLAVSSFAAVLLAVMAIF